MSELLVWLVLYAYMSVSASLDVSPDYYQFASYLVWQAGSIIAIRLVPSLPHYTFSMSFPPTQLCACLTIHQRHHYMVTYKHTVFISS